MSPTVDSDADNEEVKMLENEESGSNQQQNDNFQKNKKDKFP